MTSSLLSFVTINLNNAAGLDRTLNSIYRQTCTNYELLVIDGGSIDNSLEVLDNYQNIVSYSISEKDGGIYAAMNKGWKVATGRFCIFLNAGDELSGHRVLENIFPILNMSESDIVYGNLCSIDTKGLIQSNHFSEPIGLYYLFRWFIPHPASFIRRTLLQELDGYVVNYRILSDWLFTVQAFCKASRFEYVDQTISNFYLDGISSTNLELMDEERNRIFDRELNFLKNDWEWFKRMRPLELSRSVNLFHRFVRMIRR